MTQFKEQIDRINPGRLIDVKKICPYMNQVCIKDRCNAFVAHHEINIVSIEEKIANEKKGYDYVKALEIGGWEKYAVSDSLSDDIDTLYIRARSPGTGQGRCVI